jgi:hypothetical protein
MENGHAGPAEGENTNGGALNVGDNGKVFLHGCEMTDNTDGCISSSGQLEAEGTRFMNNNGTQYAGILLHAPGHIVGTCSLQICTMRFNEGPADIGNNLWLLGCISIDIGRTTLDCGAGQTSILIGRQCGTVSIGSCCLQGAGLMIGGFGENFSITVTGALCFSGTKEEAMRDIVYDSSVEYLVEFQCTDCSFVPTPPPGPHTADPPTAQPYTEPSAGPATSDSSGKSKGLGVGAIVGIAVGAVVVVGAGAAAFLVWRRMRRKSDEADEIVAGLNEEVPEAKGGDDNAGVDQPVWSGDAPAVMSFVNPEADEDLDLWA